MGKKGHRHNNRKNKKGTEDNTDLEDSNLQVEGSKKCPHLQKAVKLGVLQNHIPHTKLGQCSFCNGCQKEDTGVCICLRCGKQGCDRYSDDKHALGHYSDSPTHNITLHLQSMLVWCYGCDMELSVIPNSDLHECVKLLLKGLKLDAPNDQKIVIPKLGTSISTNKKSNITGSILATNKHWVKGLVNLGNTCFFNSVMQNLNQMELLHFAMAFVNRSDYSQRIVDRDNSLTVQVTTPPGSLLVSLNKLLTEFRSSSPGPLSPKFLFSEICKKAPRFRGYQQQDSQELLRYLLDSVKTDQLKRVKVGVLKHFELAEGVDIKSLSAEKKDKIKGIVQLVTVPCVDSIFAGKLDSIIVCHQCHKESRVTESFLDLSLSLVKQQEQKGKQMANKNTISLGGKKKNIPVKVKEDTKPQTLSKHQQKAAKEAKRKKGRKKGKQRTLSRSSEDGSHDVKQSTDNQDEDDVDTENLPESQDIEQENNDNNAEQNQNENKQDSEANCATQEDKDANSLNEVSSVESSNDNVAVFEREKATEKLISDKDTVNENVIKEGELEKQSQSHENKLEAKKNTHSEVAEARNLNEVSSIEENVSAVEKDSVNSSLNTENVQKENSNEQNEIEANITLALNKDKSFKAENGSSNNLMNEKCGGFGSESNTQSYDTKCKDNSQEAAKVINNIDNDERTELVVTAASCKQRENEEKSSVKDGQIMEKEFQEGNKESTINEEKRFSKMKIEQNIDGNKEKDAQVIEEEKEVSSGIKKGDFSHEKLINNEKRFSEQHVQQNNDKIVLDNPEKSTKNDVLHQNNSENSMIGEEKKSTEHNFTQSNDFQDSDNLDIKNFKHGTFIPNNNLEAKVNEDEKSRSESRLFSNNNDKNLAGQNSNSGCAISHGEQSVTQQADEERSKRLNNDIENVQNTPRITTTESCLQNVPADVDSITESLEKLSIHSGKPSSDMTTACVLGQCDTGNEQMDESPTSQKNIVTTTCEKLKEQKDGMENEKMEENTTFDMNLNTEEISCDGNQGCTSAYTPFTGECIAGTNDCTATSPKVSPDTPSTGECVEDSYDCTTTSPKVLTIGSPYTTTPGECSVESCLEQFCSPEVLEGRNKFLCEECSKEQQDDEDDGSSDDSSKGAKSAKPKKTVYTEATKQLLISSTPPVLTLHLKRFQQVGLGLKKLAKHVDFPFVLDLAPFCCTKKEIPTDSANTVLYSLAGVVEHSGGLNSGHYTAFIKLKHHPTYTIDSTNIKDLGLYIQKLWARDRGAEYTHQEPGPGLWYYVSDSRATMVTEEKVLRSQAYMLFYERLPLKKT